MQYMVCRIFWFISVERNDSLFIYRTLSNSFINSLSFSFISELVSQAITSIKHLKITVWVECIVFWTFRFSMRTSVQQADSWESPWLELDVYRIYHSLLFWLESSKIWSWIWFHSKVKSFFNSTCTNKTEQQSTVIRNFFSKIIFEISLHHRIHQECNFM